MLFALPRDHGVEGGGFTLILGEHVMLFNVVVHCQHLTALSAEVAKCCKILCHVRGEHDLFEMLWRAVTSFDPVDHGAEAGHVL